MGSPLGPTFANFYMSYIERTILQQLPEEEKPSSYFRYVDDTFLLVNSEEDVKNLINKFETIAQLKFTYELQNQEKTLSFLDVKLQIKNKTLITTLNHKTTNSPTIFNYKCFAPETYKKAIIKGELFRTLRACSTYEALDKEIKALEIKFVNSDYPQRLIDSSIKNFLGKYLNTKQHDKQKNNIELFFQNNFSSKYKQDEQFLREIIKTEIKPTEKDKKVTLRVFYKLKPLQSLLTPQKNNTPISEASHLVYQYTCPKDGCNASYIGYTCCTLKERIKNHKYNGAIKSHLNNEHLESGKNINVESSFKIIYRCQDKNSLQIAEALLIKKFNPILNRRHEGITRTLNIFNVIH